MKVHALSLSVDRESRRRDAGMEEGWRDGGMGGWKEERGWREEDMVKGEEETEGWWEDMTKRGGGAEEGGEW